MAKIVTPGVKSIFVSSTFKDMQAERDLLRDRVIPALNEFAAPYGKVVEMIDLRWGVDTANMSEEESSRQVLHTCLDEIERSRPFFIGFLGGRYGWIPDEAHMREVLESKNFPLDDLGKSVTALEMEYGALRAEEPPVCYFYFREGLDTDGMSKDERRIYLDEGEAAEKLDALKSDISRAFPDSFRTYRAGWDGEEVVDLGALADAIIRDVEASLREEWGDPPDAPPTVEEAEISRLAVFAENKLRRFKGREREKNELVSFLTSPETAPAMRMLTGGPGSGKSALLCAVLRQLDEEDVFTLPFFCGISEHSAEVTNILKMGYYRLKEAFGLESDETRECNTFEEYRNRFYEALSAAAEQKRVCFVVDALDQLFPTEEARHMQWLMPLPENVRLVATAIGGEEAENFGDKGGEVFEIPPLTGEDVREIAVSIASDYHKTFDARVIEAILEKRDLDGEMAARNPLYLTLLVQDLVMMDRYEHRIIEAYVAEGMPAVDAISRYMTELIESSPGTPEAKFSDIVFRAERLVGRDFVRVALSLVAESRTGLREADLEGAFSRLGLPFSSANFSWLRQLLREHFQQGDAGQWDFAHGSHRRALKTYIPTEESRRYGDALCAYFMDARAGDTFINREIIHHLWVADRAEEAAILLSEFDPDGETNLHVRGLVDEFANYRDIKCDENFVLRIFKNAPPLGEKEITNIAVAVGWDFVLALPDVFSEEHIISVLRAAKAFLKKDTAKRRFFALFGRGEPLSDKQNTRRLISDMMFDDTHGGCLLTMGELRKAERFFRRTGRRAKKLYRKIGDKKMLYRLSATMRRLSLSYVSRGDSKRAEACLLESLEAAEKLFPLCEKNEDRLSIGHIYALLSSFYKTQRAFEEAERYALKYLELCREVDEQGSDTYTRDQLAGAHQGLSDLYLELENYEKALSYGETAFRLAREVYEERLSISAYKSLSMSCECLGKAYDHLGDAKTALTYKIRQFEIAETVYSRTKTLQDYDNLAICHSGLARFYVDGFEAQKALPHCQETLRIEEELYRRVPSMQYFRAFFFGYLNYAKCLSQLGRKDEAEECYKKSLKTAEDTYAKTKLISDLENVGSGHLNIGDFYDAQNRENEAGPHFKKSLASAEECYRSAKNIWNLRSVSLASARLGDYNMFLGNHREAKKYYDRALSSEERIFRESDIAFNHRNFAITTRKMGDYHVDTGNRMEGIKYYTAARDLFESLVNRQRTPENLHSLADVYNALAVTHALVGEEESPVELTELERALREEVYRETGSTYDLGYLADVYATLGRYHSLWQRDELAAENIRQAIRLAEEGYEKDNDVILAESIAGYYTSLGLCYVGRDADEERRACEKAVEYREVAYRRAPSAKRAISLSEQYRRLAGVYGEQGEAERHYETLIKGEKLILKARSSHRKANFDGELAELHTLLAQYYESAGESEKAKTQYRRALKALSAHHEKVKETAVYSDLVAIYDRMVRLYIKLNDVARAEEANRWHLEAAEAYYAKEKGQVSIISLLEACDAGILIAGMKNDLETQVRFAEKTVEIANPSRWNKNDVAVFTLFNIQLGTARRVLQAARGIEHCRTVVLQNVEVCREIVKRNDTVEEHVGLGIALDYAAYHFEEKKKDEEALPYRIAAFEEVEYLFNEGGDNELFMDVRSLLFNIIERLALIYRRLSRFPDMQRVLLYGISVAEQFVSDCGEVEDRETLSKLYRNYGLYFDDMGDEAGANAQYRRSIDMLSSISEEERSDETLSELSTSYLYLNTVDDGTNAEEARDELLRVYDLTKTLLSREENAETVRGVQHACRRLYENYEGAGELPAAMATLREGIQITRDAYARLREPKLLAFLIKSYMYLAEAHEKIGEREQAEEAITTAIHEAETLCDAGEKEHIHSEYALAAQTARELYQERGEWEQAAAYGEKELSLYKELSDATDGMLYRESLRFTAWYLGKIYMELGNEARRRELHTRSETLGIEIAHELGDAESYRNLALTQWLIGEYLRQKYAFEEALEVFSRCEENARKTMELSGDPNHTTLLEDAFFGQQHCLTELQRYDAARERTEKMVELARETADSPTPEKGLATLSDVLSDAGGFEFDRMRDYERGIAYFHEAEEAARTVYEATGDLVDLRDLGQRYRTLFRGYDRIARQDGDEEAAARVTEYIGRYIDIMEEVARELEDAESFYQLAYAQEEIGKYWNMEEEFSRALDYLEKSIKNAEHAVELERKNYYRRQIYNARAHYAGTIGDAGDPERAEGEFLRAAAECTALYDETKEAVYLTELDDIYTDMHEFFDRVGDVEKAEQYIEIRLKTIVRLLEAAYTPASLRRAYTAVGSAGQFSLLHGDMENAETRFLECRVWALILVEAVASINALDDLYLVDESLAELYQETERTEEMRAYKNEMILLKISMGNMTESIPAFREAAELYREMSLLLIEEDRAGRGEALFGWHTYAKMISEITEEPDDRRSSARAAAAFADYYSDSGDYDVEWELLDEYSDVFLELASEENPDMEDCREIPFVFSKIGRHNRNTDEIEAAETAYNTSAEYAASIYEWSLDPDDARIAESAYNILAKFHEDETEDAEKAASAREKQREFAARIEAAKAEARSSDGSEEEMSEGEEEAAEEESPPEEE
ncbi:DUF4062 domain-containing protein [Oscillospiraceae bacterium OttesenSCG-928-G22]|nr:DUF4062 domain-containing protein [Oscillospiraceae bacterium OttesenSCG-928-G22]